MNKHKFHETYETSTSEIFNAINFQIVTMKVSSIWKFKTLIFVIGLILINSNLSPAIASITNMQLTLEGNVIGTLTEAEIKLGLPTTTGWGGYQNSRGTITPTSRWKGVHIPLFLTSILEELEYNVTIMALDYSINLTRAEVEGGIRTFDEENNTLTTKAIPILAYEQNDNTVKDGDGPLRLVFIGENNLSILTYGPLWVKQVITLRVTLNSEIIFSLTSISVPEFTSSTSDENNTESTSGNSFGVTILFLTIATPMIIWIRRKRR